MRHLSGTTVRSHHDAPDVSRTTLAVKASRGTQYVGGWLVSSTCHAHSVEAIVLPSSFTVIESAKGSKRGGRG